MADDLVINARVTIPAAELEFTASRASQALGEVQRQRVMAALASRLTEGGDLLLACATHRSQRRNRDEVAERLAELVRRALVPPRPRKPTRPTAASRQKRLEGKKRRGEVKRARGRSGPGDD